MNLVYTDRFAEAACELPKDSRAKLPKALRLLSENPHHPGLRTRKIQGVQNREIFEARLDQHYRFTFHLQGDLLVLRNVDHHDDCLKSP